jgi:hypothetical protein
MMAKTARKQRSKKTRKLPVAAIVREDSTTWHPLSSAGWVKDIHEHFNVFGFYRAGDLNRVLGDLRTSTNGYALSEFPVNGKKP